MSERSGLKNIRSIGKSVMGLGSRNTDLAVRISVFTAAAHCCLGLLFIAGFQVYIVLETFVRPLMWALLTGTFLFPFKSFLADLVKTWLNNVRSTSTPILAAVAWTPISLVDRGLDYVGAEIVDFCRTHGRKFLYTVGGVIAYFVLYFWLAPYLGFLGWIISFLLRATTALSTHLIWLIIIPYAAALHLFWNTEHRRNLLYAAIPLWILLTFYLYYILDEFAVPVYLFLAIIIAMGYSDDSADKVAEKPVVAPAVKNILTRENSAASTHLATPQSPLIQRTHVVESTRSTATVVVPGKIDGPESQEIADGQVEETHRGLITRLGDHSRSMGTILQKSYRNVADVITDDNLASHATESERADAEAIRSKLKDLGVGGELGEGTRYLSYVFWAFILLEVLMSFYVIPLICLPVAYRVIKILFRKQNVGNKLQLLLEPVKTQFFEWTDDRSDVMTPNFIKKILSYAKVGDRKVLSIIESVTDETVSAILICLMFVLAAVGGVIATMQVEQETSYLVTVTGNMFDDAVRNNPELYDWLPDTEEFKEHFHTVYIYGRDFALKTIRSTISDTNETRVMEIEQELTAIADRFYSHYIHKNATAFTDSDPNKGLGQLLGVPLGDPLMWLSSGPNGTNPLSAMWANGTDALSSASFTDTLMEASKYLDISRIQDFIKEHIETFTSVLESAWLILKGNLSLITSLIITIASVTLTYFSAFLNLILCSVVYLTGLFYLLSSSGKRYRPIELISAASKYISSAETFAVIVEDTISGIFAVSLKIGIFYGFYTWVLLSFCGVYVRFIPSVLGALFAVCPLVPTYVVCLPAALNMWLRGDYITFVILLVGAYLPKLFVDAAIYGDLKTTNPYMFGLSVAGGLVSMGLEGAVIGPMMLCFNAVVMESVKKVIQSRFLGTADSEEEDEAAQRTTSETIS